MKIRVRINTLHLKNTYRQKSLKRFAKTACLIKISSVLIASLKEYAAVNACWLIQPANHGKTLVHFIKK